jgi:hypothetical protein
MTFEEASSLKPRQIIFHIFLVNKTNGRPQAWRVNGKIHLWKTRPKEIRIPIARGLYQHSYLTQDNLQDFILPNPF